MIKFGIRSRLSIVDLNQEKFESITMPELFARYWPESNKVNNDKAEIAFLPDTIKVRDKNGWTDLTYMARCLLPKYGIDWCTILIERYLVPEEIIPMLPKMKIGYRKLPIPQVTISQDSDINIYDMDKPLTLYDGSTGYELHKIFIEKYDGKGYIEYKDDEEGWKFSTFKLIKNEYHPKYDACYIIKTKSGFANVNEFRFNVGKV